MADKVLALGSLKQSFPVGKYQGKGVTLMDVLRDDPVYVTILLRKKEIELRGDAQKAYKSRMTGIKRRRANGEDVKMKFAEASEETAEKASAGEDTVDSDDEFSFDESSEASTQEDVKVVPDESENVEVSKEVDQEEAEAPAPKSTGRGSKSKSKSKK